MKIFLTSALLEGAVVILDKERTVEADLMTVVIVTEKGSTTEEEMVVMTPVVEVETPEVETETPEAETETPEAETVEETVAEILLAAEARANPSSTEVVALQKVQDVAVVAVGTISVNRVTIILADELIFTASETGFDILQALNAVYVWTGHQQ